MSSINKKLFSFLRTVANHARNRLFHGWSVVWSAWIARFESSFISQGFFTALASSPVDVIKNRLMSQKKDAAVVYSVRSVHIGFERWGASSSSVQGMIDCAIKSVKNEGFMSLYKGFIPNWLRLGPWCLVMFMTYEQYRLYARRFWE